MILGIIIARADARAIICILQRLRFVAGDHNLCTRLGATSEGAFFNLFEAHYTSGCCVNSEVAADVCTRTSDLGTTGLANEYFTRVNLLAAKALHAKASAGVVVDVLA